MSRLDLRRDIIIEHGRLVQHALPVGRDEYVPRKNLELQSVLMS